jgi:hypothetical protein
MKTCWESGGTAPRILNLGTRCRWVVSFTLWLITWPLPIRREARWAPEPVWTKWRREKNDIIVPGGKWTPVVQPVAWSVYWLSYPGSITNVNEVENYIKIYMSILVITKCRTLLFVSLKPEAVILQLITECNATHVASPRTACGSRTKLDSIFITTFNSSPLLGTSSVRIPTLPSSYRSRGSSNSTVTRYGLDDRS